MFTYKFLGSGGVCPLPNRDLTALYVQNQGTSLLIDCGENTQVAAMRSNVSLFNISAIFLTHLHADHILGLPGLFSSFAQGNRTKPLVIYGPAGTIPAVSACLKLVSQITFSVLPIEIKSKETLSFPDMDISVIPLQHSITCYGYAITVDRKPAYDANIVEQKGLTSEIVSLLQKGYAIERDDEYIDIHTLFGDNRDTFKLVYATDTGYCNALVNGCKDANVAILDGSYGDTSLIPRDNSKISKKPADIHMTFSQAATVASKANVKNLILTHFTPTMPNPEDYLFNATKIFPNSVCAYTGLGLDDDYASSTADNDLVVRVSPRTMNRLRKDSIGIILTRLIDKFENNVCCLQDPDGTCVKVQIIKTNYLFNNSFCSYDIAAENRRDAKSLLVIRMLRLCNVAKKGGPNAK